MTDLAIDAANPAHRVTRAAVVALLIVLAALGLRLGYVAATPEHELRHDAIDYDVHAVSIARGEGFSDTFAYGRPTAFRPPGYPYFLAGVYLVAGAEEAEVDRRERVARVAGAFVGAAVVALLGVLAWQLAGTVVALVAMALAAVYVPLVTVGGAVMSETLFVVFMLAALVAALAHRRSEHRLRFALLAGVLAGLAILTRANALVLLAPLALLVWDRRPRRAAASLAAPAVLLVAAILTVAPWTVRNARELDAFVPVSTQLGSALAGTYNDAARLDRENPASWRSLRRVPDYADLFARVRETPEAQLERDLRREALRYIADHPLYVGEVALWSTLRTLDLAGRDRSRATAATISIERSWADAGVFCFWAFALVALAGALTRGARAVPWLVWTVPVLLQLSVVFLVVETPRYRTALDPFIVLLAAFGAVGAYQVLTRRWAGAGGRARILRP